MRRKILQFLVPACLAGAAGAAQATPVFVSTPVTNASQGSEYVYDVVATGQGNVVISASQLPRWLTLSRTGNGTATLRGTPGAQDVGSTSVTLRATETSHCAYFLLCSAFQSFTITVEANRPPVVVGSGIADQTAEANSPFSIDVAASFADPDGDALSFSASGLPTSLEISEQGVISGTPSSKDADDSPFQVIVTARDGNGGQVSDSFRLAINAPPGAADIAVEPISVDPSPAGPNVSVDWLFSVTNAGPDQSGMVDLIVEFNGTPVSFSVNPCALTVLDDRQRLACMLGPIPAGGAESVRVTGTAAQPGDVFVTASAEPGAGSLPDPVAENNSAMASLNVGRSINAEAAQVLSGPGSTGIAAGDVNGDGFDDLVLVTGSGSQSELHIDIDNPTSLNSALADPRDVRRGLSSLPLSLGGTALSTDAALGDVDQDGDMDLVVANSGAASMVFVNDGTGVMESLADIGSDADRAHAVALADLDGDGFADIVFADAGANRVYMNQGGTSFAPASPLRGAAANTADVLVADVTGDALPDLVFANADGPARIYVNLGQGAFAQPTEIDTGETSSVTGGDFNADGMTDLAFGREASGPAGAPSNPVYLNNGAGAFVLVGALGATPTVDLLSGDFNADAKTDLVVVNATGTHQVYAGDGNGNFSLLDTEFVGIGASRAAAGRFSMDERVDLALNGPEGAEVFFNKEAGEFGLGDTERPLITLNGAVEMTVKVGDSYQDPGATATDVQDGPITPAVDNPVNTAVVGSYSVTYSAMDASGNAAIPVERTVRVQANSGTGGGGGGSSGGGLMLLLLAALMWARAARLSGSSRARRRL